MKVGATIALALACGLTIASPGAAQDKIRLGYAVQVHQANMMILQDAAAKNGVTVEMTPMRRYADLQLALMTGQLDAAVLGYPNIGLMEDKGFSAYKVVSGVFNGGQSLTLAPSVKATAWKDLEGLKLGSAPNSTAELLLKASMVANGADPTKVNWVSFAQAGPPMISALKTGAIQGFVSWEPNNAEAAVQGAGNYSTLDIAANATKGVNGVLVVRSDFLAKNEAAVQKTVSTLVAVTNKLNADRNLYIRTAIEGTGAPKEVVELAIPRGSLDTKLYFDEARAMLDLIASAGITAKSWASVVNERFDAKFVERAQKASGG